MRWIVLCFFLSCVASVTSSPLTTTPFPTCGSPDLYCPSTTSCVSDCSTCGSYPVPFSDASQCFQTVEDIGAYCDNYGFVFCSGLDNCVADCGSCTEPYLGAGNVCEMSSTAPVPPTSSLPGIPTTSNSGGISSTTQIIAPSTTQASVTQSIGGSTTQPPVTQSVGGSTTQPLVTQSVGGSTTQPLVTQSVGGSTTQPLVTQSVGGSTTQPLVTQSVGGSTTQPLVTQSVGGSTTQPLVTQSVGGSTTQPLVTQSVGGSTTQPLVTQSVGGSTTQPLVTQSVGGSTATTQSTPAPVTQLPTNASSSNIVSPTNSGQYTDIYTTTTSSSNAFVVVGPYSLVDISLSSEEFVVYRYNVSADVICQEEYLEISVSSTGSFIPRVDASARSFSCAMITTESTYSLDWLNANIFDMPRSLPNTCSDNGTECSAMGVNAVMLDSIEDQYEVCTMFWCNDPNGCVITGSMEIIIYDVDAYLFGASLCNGVQSLSIIVAVLCSFQMFL